MLATGSKDLKARGDREWVRFTLLQQVPTVLLCALMLDGGAMAKVCLAAMAGYWIGVAWLQLRRPLQPSRTDALFERWGFFLLFGVSIAIACYRTRGIYP